MAVAGRSIKTLSCQCCQRWVLHSFISSVTGVSRFISSPGYGIARSIHTDSPLRRSITPTQGLRAVHSQATEPKEKHLDELDASQLENDPAVEEAASHPAIATTSTPSSSDSSLPWYLRVDQAAQSTADQTNPLLARQRIPELPDHSPQLLQPLLQHISSDLGLDDLTILDLRALDPPPALGANLLMIIATARSEKHLHVAADRLCRWLRSAPNHLRPHADGLLGRNELKIQMRRRTRRTRLLSSAGVGAKETGAGDVDDGLRTGWVCVNVGRVEGGDLPEHAERLQRAEGFVGFGARIAGYSSVVVQMLTEDKRVEVDLEKLWNGILRRAERDRDAASVAEEAAREEESPQSKHILE